MKCSLARESLSAWVDGEEAAARPLDVSRHLETCHGCTAFAERLGGLTGLTSALQSAATRPVAVTRPSPDVAADGRGRTFRTSLVLRLSLVVLSLAELGAAVAESAAEHGYGGEDHAGHESLSFTLAICAGLFWIAWRPAYARAYLPLLGVAAALLGATATVDVVSGRVEVLDELPHVGFLVGFVLLWLLSRNGGRRGTTAPRADPSPGPAPVGSAKRLRVVRGSLRAVAVAVVPMAVLVAGPSWGHGTLESSNPGSDAVVTRLPAAVTLRFDEPVTTLPTSLAVYAPDGSRVDSGEVSHPDGDGAQVSVAASGDQQGTYLVSWRVISADSHPITGAFTFSVGKRSAAPTAPASTTDRTVDVLLGASRWLGYAGAALAVGGIAFLILCWPEGWSTARPRRLALLGLGVIAAGAISSLLLKGPYDAGSGLSTLGRGSLVHEVLGSTYGHALVLRLVLVLLGTVLLLVGAQRPQPPRLALLVLVGVALLATYASAGHAVSQHPPWLAVPLDITHVAAMSVWLGGLVMLVLYVLRRPDDVDVATRAVARFSAVALGAVSLLVVTGTYQAWREVRTWDALTSTTYGRELLVKLGLVVGVLAVAAGSRRWVQERSSDLPVLRRRVSYEALGAVVVLAVTSGLVATEPARTAYHPSVSTDVAVGPDVVAVSAVPSGDRLMRLHLSVSDGDDPVEPAAVSATVSLRSQGIEQLPVKLRRTGDGQRVADVAVPVPGDWNLVIGVRTSPVDEYTATVTLPFR